MAGPMDRCPNNGQTWRDTITPILSGLDLKVLNPISKPINIAKEDSDNRKYKQKLKELKNYDALSSLMKEIRSVDLRMVDISDFIIVNVDLEIFPCGTMEEIFLANRQKKPIIVHMQQGKENAPDWLFGTLPHQLIFSNWFEIVDYLKHIDADTNIECYKRWYFFDI